MQGRRIRLRGTVQGVGMRPWVYRLARERGITGRICNEAGGVTIDAFGDGARLDEFVTALRCAPPPAATVDAIECDDIPCEEMGEFAIVDSRRGSERRVSIPADLATCDACTAEIFDPGNRRYRYPFTNCTNCGPRFTIASDVPYDRAATSMRPFRMCPDCQREYDDPSDRRFHAQPNACPVCGPRLMVVDARGPVPAEDPVRWVADALRNGAIVAVKGLGGFHLACDATSSAAVARLRARKHRDEKPFAVMVADLAEAERVAILTAAARGLLTSAERPIVLVPRRAQPDPAPEGQARPRIAPDVAPRNPLIGLMLPYTPLHHLLLADCGRPLVMTSANLTDEPIVYRNDEARSRLAAIADLMLVHDREIVTRCDDSVAAVVAGAPAILRRSRGFVPRPIRLHRPLDTPTLATGALLKNTFCLARGRDAWLGPHIGDLENADTFAAFEEAVERMEQFLGFRAELLAHDLHPEYYSTQYARSRDARACVAVQHHHAHVAGVMAEHGLDGPVLGVAFDGTGYGTDGTAWGGEFLLATPAVFERVATFRPVALPGGDAAIRQPWRLALASVLDAFGTEAPTEALPLFRSIPAADLSVVTRMIATGLNTPRARGVGRYFDAFGALALARPRASYEGQIAFELNMAAAPDESARYAFDFDRSRTPIEIDLRPAIRAAVGDLTGGVPAPLVSARFHNTLVAVVAAVVELVVRDVWPAGGAPPHVALTGGCFQNARLTEGVVRALEPRFVVHLHRRVPPGDGGIALGQAVVAGSLRRN